MQTEVFGKKNWKNSKPQPKTSLPGFSGKGFFLILQPAFETGIASRHKAGPKAGPKAGLSFYPGLLTPNPFKHIIFL